MSRLCGRDVTENNLTDIPNTTVYNAKLLFQVWELNENLWELQGVCTALCHRSGALNRNVPGQSRNSNEPCESGSSSPTQMPPIANKLLTEFQHFDQNTKQDYAVSNVICWLCRWNIHWEWKLLWLWVMTITILLKMEGHTHGVRSHLYIPFQIMWMHHHWQCIMIHVVYHVYMYVPITS